MLTDVAAESQVKAVCELHNWVLAADAEVAPAIVTAATAAMAPTPNVLMSLI